MLACLLRAAPTLLVDPAGLGASLATDPALVSTPSRMAAVARPMFAPLQPNLGVGGSEPLLGACPGDSGKLSPLKGDLRHKESRHSLSGGTARRDGGRPPCMQAGAIFWAMSSSARSSEASEHLREGDVCYAVELGVHGHRGTRGCRRCSRRLSSIYLKGLQKACAGRGAGYR